MTTVEVVLVSTLNFPPNRLLVQQKKGMDTYWKLKGTEPLVAPCNVHEETTEALPSGRSSQGSLASALTLCTAARPVHEHGPKVFFNNASQKSALAAKTTVALLLLTIAKELFC